MGRSGHWELGPPAEACGGAVASGTHQWARASAGVPRATVVIWEEVQSVAQRTSRTPPSTSSVTMPPLQTTMACLPSPKPHTRSSKGSSLTQNSIGKGVPGNVASV